MSTKEDKHIAAQPTQPMGMYPVYESEISLIDLLLILRKRQKIIYITFLAVVAVTMLYLMTTVSIYKSITIVEIGQTSNTSNTSNMFVENPNLVIEKLKLQYMPDGTFEKIEMPIIDSIKPKNKLSTNLLEIIAFSYDQKTGKQRLNDINQALIKRHEALFSSRVKSIQGRIKELSLIKIDQPYGEIEGLKSSIEPGRSYNTRVLQKPTSSIGPVKPKKRLILVLSSVLGLMLGVFAAFFVHFVSHARAEIAKADAA